MSLKQRVRDWLGISRVIDQMNAIEIKQIANNNKVSDFNRNISVQNRAFGHILARINPILGIPEDDPKRRADSDALGEEIIRRLKGEVQVTEKYRV